MKDIIYFNGVFREADQVRIEIEDRGYQFADGIYEVVIVIKGRPFRLQDHLKRLKESARALDIGGVDYRELPDVIEQLLERNGCTGMDCSALLYMQITRGTEPRSHAYSDQLVPNILIKTAPYRAHPREFLEEGVRAVTLPDERWPRCYIKTIALLPNVLAKKQARRAGAVEAILVRDGFITEGTSSNLFIVREGELLTPPATNYILNGITRQVVIELAEEVLIPVREKSISLQELYDADEVFLTGTTTWVMPVIEIDGRIIGGGLPGSLSLRLLNKYRDLVYRNAVKN